MSISKTAHLLICLALVFVGVIVANAQDDWVTMDMVHNNPGEAPTKTVFNENDKLKEFGYDAKVFFLFDAAQFGIDWKILNPDILPTGSKEYEWMMDKRSSITAKYDAASEAGLKVYCMLDMIVLPRKMTEMYGDSLLNDKGKIDIQRPFTQHCVRLLMRQMFDMFPQLSGLIIRTGETYLNDAPYYQGNNPMQTDVVRDHVTLINLLREEVCERLNKDIFYRTWDFGQFHSLPRVYEAVTNLIEPHEHLYFSIKHTMTDFWRGAITEKSDYDKMNTYWISETSKMGNPFNPCIGIGRHKQIIEVQCQREYEGKAVHPNYIAAGVINGFSEYKQADMPHPYCLNDLKNNDLVRGIWTWSRGGGWGGPYLTNEFWVELNAYVVSQWSKNRDKSEYEILTDFAKLKGLKESDIPKFHELCMLSLDGVLMGQYSKYGNAWVNWTRDNSCFDSTQRAFIKDIVKRGEQKKYLKEKLKAVKIWKKIESLSKHMHFDDAETEAYVRNSCTYARLKYSFFAASWNLWAAQEVAAIDGVGTSAKVKGELTRLQKEADKAWNLWNHFVDETGMECSRYHLNK